MDPLLSLIMANLAAVRRHDIVIDPFVGTGSILVAAAALGCQVLGSDIDYLTLHGQTKPTKAFQVGVLYTVFKNPCTTFLLAGRTIGGRKCPS